MSDNGPFAGHPDAEDMAAYLDGRVDESERERIEAHAAECPECRREIAEVGAILADQRRFPGWQAWVPAAAAAAVIGVLLWAPWTGTAPVDGVRFRGSTGPGEGAGEIQVAAPVDGSVPGAVGLSFVWGAAGPGASYQLTLTNDEGGVLWALDTTDTIASLPDTIELEPGAVHYWYVDALLEDGSHASSGVHSFTPQR